MQEEIKDIKKFIQTDLAAMIKAAITPDIADIRASLAKQDLRYDELSHSVKLLQQQLQQYETNMPSLAKRGDGRK